MLTSNIRLPNNDLIRLYQLCLRYGFALTNTSISSLLFTCRQFQHTTLDSNTNTLDVLCVTQKNQNMLSFFIVCIELVYVYSVYLTVCLQVWLYLCSRCTIFLIGDRFPYRVNARASHHRQVRNFQSVIIFYSTWYVTIFEQLFF